MMHGSRKRCLLNVEGNLKTRWLLTNSLLAQNQPRSWCEANASTFKGTENINRLMGKVGLNSDLKQTGSSL